MARRKRTDGPTRVQHEDALRRHAQLPEGLQAYVGSTPVGSEKELREWADRTYRTATRFANSGGRYDAVGYIRKVKHDLVLFRRQFRRAADKALGDFDRLLSEIAPSEPKSTATAWSEFHKPSYWRSVFKVDGVEISQNTLRRRINKGELKVHPASTTKSIAFAKSCLPRGYSEQKR